MKNSLGIFISRRQLKRVRSQRKKKPTKIVEKLRILDPEIREEYSHFESRETELRKTLTEHKNLQLTGEAGIGKTRTLIEVIRNLARENPDFKKTYMIIVHSGSIFKEIKIYRRFLIKRYRSLLLFVDDIDKYIENPFLHSFISQIRRISKSVQMVCTYRTEGWFGIRNTEFARKIQGLFPSKIVIPKLTLEQGKEIARVLDVEFPLEFNGTAAEVALGQIRKKEEYSKFSKETKRILFAIKLLFYSGNFSVEVNLVKQVATKIFSYSGDWNTEYRELLEKKYFQEITGRIITREFVVQNIVEDYPAEKTEEARIQSVLSDLTSLQSLLIHEKLWVELLPLSLIFSLLEEYDLALKCFLNERRMYQILPKDQKIHYYLYKGLVFKLKRDYNEAYKNFSKVLKYQPNSATSYYSRGLSSMMLGNFEDALDDIDKAIELDPENRYFHLDRSAILMHTGQIEDALSELRKLTQIYPNDVNFLYNLATVEHQLGNYQKAISIFERVLELDSNFPYAYLGLGTALFQLKSSKKALEILDKLIELDSEMSTGYILRGNIHLATGNIEQAKNDLQNAVKFEPGRRSFFFRGKLSLDLMDNKKAIDDFKTALTKDLERSELTKFGFYIYTSLHQIHDDVIHQAIATTQHRMGKNDEAIETLTNALNKGTENALIYLDRGNYYLIEGNLEEAEKDLEEAAKLGCDTVLFFNVRGALHIKRSRFKEALEDFKQALRIQPNYIEALLNKTTAHIKMSEFRVAIEDCNKILEINNKEYRALNNRGLAYRELKEYDKSLQDLNKSIELAPEFVDPYRNRSSLYGQIKQYAKALDDANKALELSSDALDAYHTRSAIYAITGKYDKAIEDCNTIIKSNNQDIGAYNNRGLTYRIQNKVDEAISDFNTVWENSTEFNKERRFIPFLMIDLIIKREKINCKELQTWIKRSIEYVDYYNEEQKKTIDEGKEILQKDCNK